MADKGGLEGVVVARSRLCSIDGINGVLIYSGYDVGDLAEHSSYEEVCFLTLRGRLPTRAEMDEFTAELTSHRDLSEETESVVDMLATHAAPMEMLRTAVSSDSFDDPDKDSNADDANVRKAMRLIVDRPAMLAQVLSGHGRVANDLYSPFDADFDKALPQRHQDIDQAKALLKAAGMENLTVDLHTTDGAAGMVDSANVFASQAKAAGVTINVKNDPNYYGDQYLKLPFSVDFWGTRSYLAQAALGSIQGAAYNECHWGLTGTPYLSLYKQAVAAPNLTKRHELVIEMQKLEYNQGGYIIPFFNNLIDAYSSKVTGFVPSKGTLNLDAFGHGYRTIWFA